MSGAALTQAVHVFDGAAGGAKWHVRIRRALSRLEAVEALVPQNGNILEIGCGHGLFAHYLALAAPTRRVLGIDIDPRKIDAALKTVGAATNITFAAGDALKPPAGPFQCIVYVDVLYLLDEAQTAAALRAARASLAPGGVLVWKSQECRPRWKYWITCGQEWLATRTGLTAGSSLTFLPRERALALLRDAGFANPRAVDMPGRIYTDVIYVADA